MPLILIDVEKLPINTGITRLYILADVEVLNIKTDVKRIA